jgi:hypothetical protein
MQQENSAKTLKQLMFVVVFLFLGSATGLWITGQGAGLLTGLLPLFSSNSTAIYQASDNSFNRESYPDIEWEALLPESEKALIGRQATEPSTSSEIPLHEQVFQSIKRTFDSNYQQALVSTNTVAALNNTPVSLNGFIVPVEANAEREITAFFVVPYFGACIHYPPPPPNQIVFIDLGAVGLGGIDIQQAYTFSGMLTTGLYEDPQGTSAYILDAVHIAKYDGKNAQGSFHLEGALAN